MEIWEQEEEDDWKSFLEIAKEEGIETIIVEAIDGEEPDHTHEIGSIVFAWQKEGVTYTFMKQTDWCPSEEDT
jgi:protein tyrosine phosphatase (PTP) superfamily phosphohydrolase (DUF442 family)